MKKVWIIVLICVLLGVIISVPPQRLQIRNEIFDYVLENHANSDIGIPNGYQEFVYATTGLLDGGVEYGYYYSPDDDHCLQGEPYRRGYRTYGIPDDETDWYYSERICENWFYYEIHDG